MTKCMNGYVNKHTNYLDEKEYTIFNSMDDKDLETKRPRMVEHLPSMKKALGSMPINTHAHTHKRKTMLITDKNIKTYHSHTLVVEMETGTFLESNLTICINAYTL